MKKRMLKNLVVSEIGMGCMGFSHGYGKIPDEPYSIEAIRKAYDYGCTFFDTAEVYSPNLEGLGHNERIVGKAVKDFRKNIVLATKLFIGTEEPEHDGSIYDTLMRHLKSSMERLRTDYVDLYYLHRVNPSVPVEDVARAMGRLIQEGVIRGWGMSQVPVGVMERAQAVAPLAAVQNIYSMMERDSEEEVIPWCIENNVGFVPFSPVASGFLSGQVTAGSKFEGDDVRKFVPQLKDENIAANQPILDVLERFAALKGATMAQASLAWMIHKYPNVVPIPGSKNKDRILENLRSSEVSLTRGEFESLEEALGKCKIHGHRGYDESEKRNFIAVEK